MAEPKPMTEEDVDAAKIDGLIFILEHSGKLDTFKEKFGIKALEVKLDKTFEIVAHIYTLLLAIQKGLEDED